MNKKTVFGEEITIKLPPGSIADIEYVTRDWVNNSGVYADSIDQQVQWFIMEALKFRKEIKESGDSPNHDC